MFISA